MPAADAPPVRSGAPDPLEDRAAPTGGIVRAARRPPGWVAPGPPPRPPADPAPLLPGPGEDLCWLAGNWRILQRTDGHRFSLDDLLTAHLAATIAAARPPRRTLDLGCGIGSVLLFVAWRFPEARALGVEAQALSLGLARRSLAWNGVEHRVEVRHGDFRDPAPLAGEAPFDLVTGTPPYFPIGTGLESDHVQKGPCRFEHRGGIEAYCAAAARALGPGAPFVACAPANQRARVEAAVRAAGLALERWRDVVPRTGKAPLISVFAMRRAGEAGTLVEEAPLVVRDEAGRRTAAFVRVREEMGMPP
jgi:tRNA1(Val) A37 N6-methylase TrmN6